MAFSFSQGCPVGRFEDGKYKNKRILRIIKDDDGDLIHEEEDGYDNLGRHVSFKSKLSLVPNVTKEREIIYIAGRSGSGKTTIASKYIKAFKNAFGKKKPIYVFSRKKSDPTLDPLNLNWIELNKSLIDQPIDITKCKELKNGALFLFDDIGTVQDDKINKAVKKLLCDVLEVGRSFGIYVIVTNHLLNPNDTKMGRIILNELDSLIIFPRGSNFHAVNYCLKNYFGYDKNKINLIMNLPSRWVKISREYPEHILYNKGGFIF
jgi:hypothetical protein